MIENLDIPKPICIHAGQTQSNHSGMSGRLSPSLIKVTLVGPGKYCVDNGYVGGTVCVAASVHVTDERVEENLA